MQTFMQAKKSNSRRTLSPLVYVSYAGRAAALALWICFLVSPAFAVESIVAQSEKAIDFSRAILRCNVRENLGSAPDISLILEAGNVELQASNTQISTERACYQLKFDLEDHFALHPQQTVGLTTVMIENEICDRNRECWPLPETFRYEASLHINGIAFKGVERVPLPQKSESIGRGQYDGCQYYGKLGGGWECSRR